MSRIHRANPRARPGIGRAALATPAIAALLLESCVTPLSMFSHASKAAGQVTRITIFMIVLSGIIYVGVIAIMLAAMMRNRRRNPVDVDLSKRSNGWIIWGGAVMPGIVLIATFVVSMSAMGRPSSDPPAVTILVTGHQWWWQIDYEFPNVDEHFRTANEIHVPAGRPVRLLLTSADVIHSFWVPALQGKLDVIPGDTNELRITVAKPGTYLGTCMEYCGLQHAHMGLVVVAQDSAGFVQWAAHQLTDGAAPHDSLTAMGQRLFVGGACSLCHTVRGTPAEAQVAPDLTHVGSRLTLAAGTLPNSLGNLEGWIANAQSIKPGAKMPTLTTFDGGELRALALYVESLK